MRLENRDRRYFLEILNRYKDGTASQAESLFVQKYFDLNELQPDILDSLSEAEIVFLETEIKGTLLQKINASVDSTTVVVRPYRWLKIAVAASLLIVFGAGIYLGFVHVNHPQPVAKKQVIQPEQDIPGGSNKAILTLSDGSTVLLDDKTNGLLTTQGNSSLVKLAGDELVYRPNADANEGIVYNTMATPRGGKYKLLLADGSKVWLNAASSITYPTLFSGPERIVQATGEVYLETAKDSKRPFKVRLANQCEVRVFGTHFNINSYGDNGAVQTTLLEGSVKVIMNDESVLLSPGQQAEIALRDFTRSQTGSSPVKNIKVINDANIEQVIAWKNGYFHFDRADLKTMMYQIARWYDVEVIYDGVTPKDKFIGELPMDANISEVLRALEKTGVLFRIEGKKIIVNNKN